MYKYTDRDHNFSSAREIVPYLFKRFNPASVVDFGCGRGEFLSVFKEFGCYVRGIDNPIPKEKRCLKMWEYIQHDLNKPFRLQFGSKCDLCLCLEVAEHLPASSARTLVKSLVDASDTIIFSAAIPGQRGQKHLNEQYPQYWAKLFNEQGYRFIDAFREDLWNNENILWWYRQNIFLATKGFDGDQLNIRTLIHPELYKKKQIWWGLRKLNDFLLKHTTRR